MTKRVTLALAIGAMLLAGSEVALGDDRLFASAGGGGGSDGLGWTLSANVVRNRTLFAIRASAMEELAIFGPSPSESFKDYGLLIGRASTSRRGLLYVAAGLGVARSVQRGPRIAPRDWLFGARHERWNR